MLQNFVLTRHFSTVLALERSRPSAPRITYRARANWFVSPPFLSSALNQPAMWTRAETHDKHTNIKRVVFFLFWTTQRSTTNTKIGSISWFKSWRTIWIFIIRLCELWFAHVCLWSVDNAVGITAKEIVNYHLKRGSSGGEVMALE